MQLKAHIASHRLRENAVREIKEPHLLALILKALSSAAWYELKANKLMTYKATKRTMMSLRPPFPTAKRCSPAKAPSLTGRLGSEADPSVRPFDWNAVEDAPGPEESLAALRTAAVKAEGLAPRIVSTTELDLMTRKVGILVAYLLVFLSTNRNYVHVVGGDLRRYSIFACNFLLRIDVDFNELEFSWSSLLFCKLLENRRNGFAWAAPVSIEVDNRVC